ncbi:MAG TPA: 4-alpha-glucanotransferase [Gammaproteobacteria bacterium]
MNNTTEQDASIQPNTAVCEALRLLEKDRLALAIHDSSFPGTYGQDIGRGSPYTEAAAAFLAFARHLGFDTLQLGPQGESGVDNPSPYDGTLFSKSFLNLDLPSLLMGNGRERAGAWLSTATLQRLVEECPASDGRHSNHAYAYQAVHHALDEIYLNFVTGCASGEAAALLLQEELKIFSAHQQQWLQADALYHTLAAEHGWLHQDDWPQSNEACADRMLYHHDAKHASRCAARRGVLLTHYRHRIERYSLGQLLLHQQHARFHSTMKQWGLRIYGDLQVGISPCDLWSRGALYLQHYRMGAPPSRTNPEGQPWGYGVLDPEQYQGPDGAAGPVLRFLATRVRKMMEEFDGLRIDHPHGLVCPWVYRSTDPDPYHAVQQGARLFSSPHLADHPELTRYAIVNGEQLNESLPRYADGWVGSLDSKQLDRYAVLIDQLMQEVRLHGATSDDVLCEVLSTLPFPLAQVIARHGLGRFRVTQKADLSNPADVYRSENAHPEDWIMVGNHDTPPLWRLAKQWAREGRTKAEAEYLTQRLRPDEESAAFAALLADDWRKLVHAKMADLFVSPARQVMIFFPDLLGMEAIYNRPGIIDPANWTLRVPPDYAARYPGAAAKGEALNLHCVLALAMRARGKSFAQRHAALIQQLLNEAGEWARDWIA